LPFLLIRSLSGLDAYSSDEPRQHYGVEWQVLGTELENFVLQKLLKLTELPFRNQKEVEQIKKISNLSMLGRRGFKTIYKVLPEYSMVNYAFIPYEHRETAVQLLESIGETNSETDM